MDETSNIAPEAEAPIEAVAEAEPSEEEVTAPEAEPAIPIDTFLMATGRKPDQTAGFIGWARAGAIASQTMPEWEATWERFMKRPIR